MESLKFIGRKRELEEIKNFITSPDARVLCLQAEGGIGKTRLLTQIQAEFDSFSHFQICEIIDFDDPRFHLPDRIGQEIAQQLGNELFENYFGGLQHKRFLEEHKASPEYLAGQSSIIENEFLKAFQDATGERRLILRFDATDNLRGLTPPLEYVVWLAKNLPRTCIVVAGRNSTQVLKMMGTFAGKSLTLILNPLSPADCLEYLREKLDQKMIPMRNELVEKLVLLSRGRIILLDMAVEWLIRENVVPQWLQDMDVSLLETEDMREGGINANFESHLFDHVRALRSDLDRLVLLLARVHPLDKEGIQTLLTGLPVEKIDALLQRARALTFVKRIPDGYLKLHDEAESLINKYVWTQIAPKRKRATSEAAIAYLEQKSNRILEEYRKQKAHKWHKELEMEYTFYTLRIQQLRHILALDAQVGIETFHRNLQLAEEYFRSPIFEKMLLDEILPALNNLGNRQQWEIMLLQANRLLNEEEYSVAVNEFLDPLLQQLSTEDSIYRIRAWVARGNAYIHLGQIDQAVNDMQSATELSRHLNDVEWEMHSQLVLAELQRLKGDLDRAGQDYLHVLRRTLEIGDNEKQARVQREFAFLKNLQGEHESAVHLIEHAIHIWEHLPGGKRAFYEDLGKAFTTAGIVYREIGQVGKALNYFERAMGIFEESGLEELRSIARAQIGIAHLLMGEYVEAEENLELALEHSSGVSKYETRYYLAHTKWALADRGSAEKMFRQSLSEAHECGDAFYELHALCALSRMSFEYEMEHLSNWQDFLLLYNTFRENYPAAHFSVMTGIFFTHLGHLAVKQKNLQKAIEFYISGLPQLAVRHNSFHLGDFNLYGQFRFIHNKVKPLLSRQRLRELGGSLEKAWSDQALDVFHPEVLTFLWHWKYA